MTGGPRGAVRLARDHFHPQDPGEPLPPSSPAVARSGARRDAAGYHGGHHRGLDVADGGDRLAGKAGLGDLLGSLAGLAPAVAWDEPSLRARGR